MKTYITRQVPVLVAVGLAVAMLALGLLAALGVRSLLAGTASAGPAAPNPGHEWTQVEGHGIDGSTYWLGTTADQALELRVNGARTLRLEPNATSPNVIGGYDGNAVMSGVAGATIGGGGLSPNVNRVTDNMGTVGGGENNQAGNGDADANNAAHTTVSGGYANTAGGRFATVGGGSSNSAGGLHATIGGGLRNTTSADGTTISGGADNAARSNDATVGGGDVNEAIGLGATVAGGSTNLVSDNSGTVGGGMFNQAGDNAGTTWDRPYATVSGGYSNQASGSNSTVGGGWENASSSNAATVAGGASNTASADSATVGGGSTNVASGAGATVPGGLRNAAAGYYSFAAGRRAKANNDGCFVWADATDADVACNDNNRFVARASGGVYLYTSGDLSTGAYLAAGSGSWYDVSSRDVKENFTTVGGQEVLTRLAEVPISTWNYKAQDTSIRHIGPMAQDFYAAFGLGESLTAISTVDADGVALAAVQGLYELSQDQAARIQGLEGENTALRQRLDSLEARASALESGADAKAVVSQASSSGLPVAWLLLGGGLGVAAVGLTIVKRRLPGDQN